MSDTTLGRALNAVRNIAEDTLERVEKRWDQAMDVIHGRPIRHHDRDPDSDANGYATKEYREKAQVSMNAVLNALGGGEREAAEARDRLDYQLRHPGPGEIAERHADLAGDATVDRDKIDTIMRQEAMQARRQSIRDGTNDGPVSHAARHLQNAAEYRAEIVAGGYREPGPDPFSEREGSTWAKHDNIERKELTELARAEVRKARDLRENNKPISWEAVGDDRQTLPFVDGKENGTMDSEVKTARQHVREREQERWNRVEKIGRQAIDADRARVTEKPTATTEADLATKAERQRPQTA